MTEARKKELWHFDKTIPLSVIVALFLQFAAAIWYVRDIEIMTANALDPFGYGFICHDAWEDTFIEHEAVGDIAAWTEQTQHSGDRYGFRMDELLMFIARGFESRLSALESA